MRLMKCPMQMSKNTSPIFPWIPPTGPCPPVKKVNMATKPLTNAKKLRMKSALVTLLRHILNLANQSRMWLQLNFKCENTKAPMARPSVACIAIQVRFGR